MIIPLLVLALIQGLLEFLPVSSEGQILLIAVNVYGFDANMALSVIFWLHLGTAFAVIMFYNQDIFGPLFRRLQWRSEATPTTINDPPKLFGPLFVFIIVGTLGTALTALPLYFFLKSLVPHLAGETVSALVGVLLIITGVIMYLQRGKKGAIRLNNISLAEAFVLGLIQGIAVLPGISRSGMTLTWLLVRGVKREEALRLSFLLGVPATFGVIVIEFLLGAFFITLLWILLVMILVALFTGLCALALLRYSAVRIPWWMFCLVLGSLVLIITLPTILTIYGMGFPW